METGIALKAVLSLHTRPGYGTGMLLGPFSLNLINRYRHRGPPALVVSETLTYISLSHAAVGTLTL